MLGLRLASMRWFQLRSHRRPAADRPADDGLVDDRPELRCLGCAESSLPGHADRDALLDILVAAGHQKRVVDGAGVILGLEQSGHEL